MSSTEKWQRRPTAAQRGSAVWRLAFTRYCFTSKLHCGSLSSFYCPTPPATPTLLQYYRTTSAQCTPPHRLPLCMPYTIHYWRWQYCVKVNLARRGLASDRSPRQGSASTRYSFCSRPSYKNQYYYANTPVIWAPHPPPPSPTLLRNVVFQPDHHVLQCLPYNIGTDNIV